MFQLVKFELEKIWKKPSFLLSVAVLICLDVFLLWYTNIPHENEPDLSAYKQFQMDISHMTEAEKGDFVESLKENIDGISVVQNILMMQQISGEMGETLVEQEMEGHPGVFEQYYDVYLDGSYLRYTDSYEKEKNFIDEIYAEYSKVSTYGEYLTAVQQNKSVLSGISIFAQQETESFSSRNVKKSAKDYAQLTADSINWFSSKGVVLSMENQWLDILLLLFVFLFAGSMIIEEKDKKLLYITRCTKNGIVPNICAKIGALFLHCVTLVFLFCGVNMILAWQSTGAWNWLAPIQSLAPYIESNLSITVLEYMIYSVFAKIVVLFVMGVLICILCMGFKQIFLPYVVGFVLWGIGWLLYNFLPAGTVWNTFKYLNIVGFFRTENLYGGYLNFDFGGYPISRLGLSWSVIGSLAGLTILGCVLTFIHMKNFEIKGNSYRFSGRIVPHTNLLRHEGYKILIMNRGAMVLLIFAVLIGWNDLQQEYRPSVYEQYYQNIMLQLEGKLTEEKETLIQAEQARFQEAFDSIVQVDEMVSRGELSEDAGETLKSKWYSVTAFYSSFERVENQYQRIQKNGGEFVYDTGYLYFFGQIGDGMLTDLLLLSIAIVLAFSNVIAVEYESGVWKLIGTTACGKQKVFLHKMLICLGLASAMAFVPVVCRFISISAVYPMRSISILGWMLLFITSQILAVMIVAFVVLLISNWRKTHIQTIFFAVLILVVPLVLNMLGFSFAEWFSVYPLYFFCFG